MAEDTFNKVSAAIGNRLDAALKGFMQDVADIAAGQKPLSALTADGAETFNLDELHGFLAQLGGAEFCYSFRSRTPKLTGTILRPSVLLPSGPQDPEAKVLGFGGSIGIVGTITF